MKIDASYQLQDINGEGLTEQVKKDDTVIERPITLGSIIVNALLGAAQDDQSTGAEKLKRYQLAKLFNAGGEVQITVEDATLIKTLVGKGYVPLVVGQVYEQLEK